jgi:hypothetical protein
MTPAFTWSRCWSLVVALGVGLSFLVWGPADVAAMFSAGASCAAILLVLCLPHAGEQDPPAMARWKRIGGGGAAAGACVVALASYSAVVPYLVLPLVALAVLTLPGVRRLLRRWLAARPAATAHRPTASASVATGDRPGPQEAWPAPADCRPAVSDQSVRELTDTELCLQWRRSFVTLQSARSPADLARVVAQRQVYLDEMERRSPSALRAWFASGARAAGGPDRFINGERRDGRSDAA